MNECPEDELHREEISETESQIYNEDIQRFKQLINKQLEAKVTVGIDEFGKSDLSSDDEDFEVLGNYSFQNHFSLI